MNFVRYNPENNQVICYGAISSEAMEYALNSGEPIIEIDKFPENFAIHLYDVDTSSKKLILSQNPRPDPLKPAPEIPERNRLPAISDKQFFMKLALDGYISKEDALSAVQSGFIPAPIQKYIDGIQDTNIRFDAEMLFSGATLFYRPHAHIEGFLVEFGLDLDAMNNFFKAASQL